MLAVRALSSMRRVESSVLHTSRSGKSAASLAKRSGDAARVAAGQGSQRELLAAEVERNVLTALAEDIGNGDQPRQFTVECGIDR